MAIVGMEGFDYFETTYTGTQIDDHVNYTVQQPLLNTVRILDTAQRFGTGKYLGLYQNLNDFIVNTIGTTITSTIYVSFAFKTSINMLYNTDFFIIYNQYVTGAHIWLRLNPGGTITAWSGNGEALGQSAQTINLDTWYWMEVKIVVNGSTGSVNLKVNGVDFLTLSSKNTQVGTSAQIGAFAFGGGAGSCFFDDVVWQDSGGDYLGDSRIQTLLPTGDSSIQWSQTGTGSNANDVNNIDSTVDDDYVYTATTTNKDYYTYDTISSASTVHALAINYRAKKDNVSSRSVRSIHSASADTGTSNVLAGNWVFYSDIFEDDGTNPWDQTSISFATFGIEDVT